MIKRHMITTILALAGVAATFVGFIAWQDYARKVALESAELELTLASEFLSGYAGKPLVLADLQNIESGVDESLSKVKGLIRPIDNPKTDIQLTGKVANLERVRSSVKKYSEEISDLQKSIDNARVEIERLEEKSEKLEIVNFVCQRAFEQTSDGVYLECFDVSRTRRSVLVIDESDFKEMRMPLFGNILVMPLDVRSFEVTNSNALQTWQSTEVASVYEFIGPPNSLKSFERELEDLRFRQNQYEWDIQSRLRKFSEEISGE